MGESIIQVTEGSGKKIHTWQRTIGANNVEDDSAIIGEPGLASYSVIGANIASTTANSHLLQIMAGASLNVRIRKIRIRSRAAGAAIFVQNFQLFRLTTAGTGGTVITPAKMDNGDAAAGATAMSLPTVKGTEGVEVYEESVTVGTATVITAAPIIEWPGSNADEMIKPLIIPAGATNGIAIKNLVANVVTWDVIVWITETSFL